MKKIVLIFMVMMLAGSSAFAKVSSVEVSKTKLVSLINEYSGCEGFEVVTVGSFGVSAIKALIRLSGEGDDPEVREVLKAIKGIKKIAIVDFEDCNSDVKAKINKKLEKILAPTDVLVEMKDGGDHMAIYGVVDDNAGVVRDFVLHSSDSCSLICLFGSISMDQIAKLASM